jgi:transposase InsO family protein
MPWKDSSPMDERIKFVATYLEGSYSFSSLCSAFEISRKTGYKWLMRYAEAGAEGLMDASRAPKTSPQRLTAAMKKLLLETRTTRPKWGPKKIVAWLEKKHPNLNIPAPSTVGELFKKAGLIPSKERAIRTIKQAAPVFDAHKPNAVWSVDFKGEFKLGDGGFCYPLTITDNHSRFILCCQGHLGTHYLAARLAFEKVFEQYGLPEVILSDNGTPFSSPSGLSQLNVWWTKLGIKPLRIQPGKPQQNGRHERMHRTLKQHTAYPPQTNMEEQQKSFDAFVQDFNYERPHEAINNLTPSVVYTPSTKPLPKEVKKFTYPKYMELKVAGLKGEIRWKGKKYFLGRALEDEEVALEEKDDGLWIVHFGPIQVGYIIKGARRLERSLKKAVKVSPMSQV